MVIHQSVIELTKLLIVWFEKLEWLWNARHGARARSKLLLQCRQSHRLYACIIILNSSDNQLEFLLLLFIFLGLHTQTNTNEQRNTMRTMVSGLKAVKNSMNNETNQWILIQNDLLFSIWICGLLCRGHRVFFWCYSVFAVFLFVLFAKPSVYFWLITLRKDNWVLCLFHAFRCLPCEHFHSFLEQCMECCNCDCAWNCNDECNAVDQCVRATCLDLWIFTLCAVVAWNLVIWALLTSSAAIVGDMAFWTLLTSTLGNVGDLPCWTKFTLVSDIVGDLTCRAWLGTGEEKRPDIWKTMHSAMEYQQGVISSSS